MYFFDRYNPIGIFDSGIGGLTVVKKVSDYLPNESIVYFGDTARVPYGSKSNETVIDYSIQDADFLIKKSVKLIVVACNTASSVALDKLRQRYNIPIIGMIKPGAKMALSETRNNRIGVIGTNATINSKAYSTELKQRREDIFVIEKACPLFVPLAEEGWSSHRVAKLVAEEYLRELKELNIDTLILGCTHYPILSEVIQEVMGPKVKLVDSGAAASLEVEDYFKGTGVRNESNQLGHYDFYVSDLPVKFKSVAERFLGKEIRNLKKIELEELINH